MFAIGTPARVVISVQCCVGWIQTWRVPAYSPFSKCWNNGPVFKPGHHNQAMIQSTWGYTYKGIRKQKNMGYKGILNNKGILNASQLITIYFGRPKSLSSNFNSNSTSKFTNSICMKCHLCKKIVCRKRAKAIFNVDPWLSIQVIIRSSAACSEVVQRAQK